MCDGVFVVNLVAEDASLYLQNQASGNGVQANPKLSDISWVRDGLFRAVYAEVNKSMIATSAPKSTLRGES